MNGLFKAVATVAAVSLLAISLPASGSEAKTSSVVLSKFTGSYIDNTRKSELAEVAQLADDLTSITCLSYISKSKKSLARDSKTKRQAKNTCSYIKSLNPDVKIRLSSWRTNDSSLRDRVKVVYTYELSTSQGELTSEGLLSSLDVCRLQKLKINGGGNQGLPWGTRNTRQPLGTIAMPIVFIEFPDAKATMSVDEREPNLEKNIEEWSTYISRGKVFFDVQIHKQWLMAPKPYSWYTRDGKMQSLQQSVDQLIAIADPYYDFSGAEVINFVFSNTSKTEGLYGDAHVRADKLDETTFIFGAYNEFLHESLWDWIVHEMLHPLGFLGHGPDNGGKLGILMSQWNASEAVTSWEGFLAGWYNEQEVACVDSESMPNSFKFKLTSLDDFGDGYESLILKLDNKSAIVVEYRTSDNYGYKGLSEPILTAYRVNQDRDAIRCDMCNQLELEKKNWWAYLRDNGNIAIRTQVSYEGITIKNLGNGNFEVSK